MKGEHWELCADGTLRVVALRKTDSIIQRSTRLPLMLEAPKRNCFWPLDSLKHTFGCELHPIAHSLALRLQDIRV